MSGPAAGGPGPADPELHVTSSSGVVVALHDLGGDPNGSPILFCHATGFCGSVWRPVARELAEHRCWALDFRCHGGSTRPIDDDLSWSGTADDVLAVIDRLGLVRPLGVGHSMGGAALLLAEQRRPGTFAALWCFEPIVIPADMAEPDGGNLLAEGAARRREVFDSFAAARANFASKPPMQSFAPDALDGYVEGGFEQLADGTVRLRCRAADESRFYRLGAEAGAGEHLDEVGCPVTVVRGRVEPGPAQFAPAVADAVRDGHLVEDPSVGHFGPMEDPVGTARSIRGAAAVTPRQ